MDKRFIKWLAIYDEFSEGTVLRDILNDAIRCYRHDIARPAFLLSYIAFMQAVRNNLLNSEKPDGFKEGRWNACMANLRNENKWDEVVSVCIRQKKDTQNVTFFELPDSIRTDFDYWRNRRNDCAHYKSSEITLSHVSAFWMFIMENYNKFTPIGGLQQSINDYKRHYDISLTPKGKDTDKIFNRLCLAIKSENDLEEVMKEVFPLMEIKAQVDLLHNLFTDSRHRQKVANVLKSNMKNLRTYLYSRPADVSLLLGDDPEMTRQFWYNDFSLFGQCLNVYVQMLRGRMLPKEEIEESLELLLKCKYDYGSFQIEDSDFQVLAEHGIYDLFIDNYLTKENLGTNYKEKNYKTEFYISFIKHGGITDKMIKTLSESFEGNHPYVLSNKLQALFCGENEYKQQYLDSISRQGLEDFLHIGSEDKNEADNQL